MRTSRKRVEWTRYHCIPLLATEHGHVWSYNHLRIFFFNDFVKGLRIVCSWCCFCFARSFIISFHKSFCYAFLLAENWAILLDCAFRRPDVSLKFHALFHIFIVNHSFINVLWLKWLSATLDEDHWALPQLAAHDYAFNDFFIISSRKLVFAMMFGFVSSLAALWWTFWSLIAFVA